MRVSDCASFVETYICANCAETSGQQSTCEYLVLDGADHLTHATGNSSECFLLLVGSLVEIHFTDTLYHVFDL